MNGFNRNTESLNVLFNSKSTVKDCVVNKYISIGKLIESNIRLYDLIKGKHAEKGYGIVSACRGTDSEDLKDKEENRIQNKNNTRQLAIDIKNAGYSYMPVYGGYVEDENGEVLEASFVVFNYDNHGNSGDFEKLKSFLIDMCGKYNQDSVLLCEPNGVPTYYDKTGNIVSAPDKSSRNVKVNDKDSPYFTKFKNKKFTYDIAFPEGDDELTSSLAKIISEYDYLRKRPETYNERQRRWWYGEVFV